MRDGLCSSAAFAGVCIYLLHLHLLLALALQPLEPRRPGVLPWSVSEGVLYVRKYLDRLLYTAMLRILP